MKKVAVLHDALNGVNFGFVVKSASSYEFYGVDAHSNNWASWANDSKVKSLHSLDMPPGVIVGAFKQVEDSVFSQMVSGETSSMNVQIQQRKNFMFSGTHRVNSKSRTPAVYDTPIRHFNNEQFLNVVNYKGLAFRFDAQKSSMMREVKSNGYAFDLDTAKFNPNPSMEQKSLIRERIEANTSTSFERRLGVKALKTLVHGGQRTQINRFSQTEEKALGRSIGGGTARGVRRAGAGLASRFDPNAWDGDGDGIVQDSTPFQRPAIPGINDISTGGRVNARAATRAWNQQQGGRQQMQVAEGRGAPKRTVVQNRGRSAVQDAVEPSARRQSTAGLRSRMERSAIDSGMRSRAAVKKTPKSGASGITKVDPSDGTAWASMTDEQKEIVKENLALQKKHLMLTFQAVWESYLRNPKNKQKHPGIDVDSDITNDFLPILQAAIQDNEREAISAVSATDPDRDKKLAAIDKKYQDFYQKFDDIATIHRMQGRDNHEMLEHLHGSSRKAAVGIPTGRQKVQGLKPIEGKFTSLDGKESTFFGRSGRAKKYVGEDVLETGEKARVKRRTSQKLEQLSRRLLDPNPKRVARRERRKARKAGIGRTAGQAEARRKGLKRRIARARRQIAGRLRGDETADKIIKRNASTKPAHPLQIADDGGAITVTKQWVARMAFIEDELNRLKAGEKTESKRTGKVTNDALLLIWENMEQNGLPTQISEEQVQTLVDAGLPTLNRGVGNDTGFVDSYLEDEDRFIPGQGGSAYGVGEYWAPESSGFAWSSAYGNARILGFISPDARVIEKRDLNRIISEGAQIKDAIRAYDSGMPGDEASKMDPKEYVEGLMNYLSTRIPPDSALWNSPLGQVYKQMLDQYSKVADGSKEKREMWSAMQYVNKMFSHDPNYFAPVLGYDAITDSGNVSVVHNRGAMIVVNKPLTNEQGRRIVENAKAGIVVPSVKPAKKSKNKANSVVDTSGWQQTGPQTGSNPGGKFRDSSGREYYVKWGRSQAHAEEETLASSLYKELGVGTAEVRVGDNNGQVQVVSTMVDGARPLDSSDASVRAARSGLVADAWLANWDATANPGNIVIDSNGNARRIDLGGSLSFRARGASKGFAFGNEAREMETLRDPSMNSGGAAIFRGITPDEIKAQVDALRKISEQRIAQLVSDTVTDPQQRADLTAKLIARRQWIIKNYG